jgi:CRISPR/Cas system-associated exonuclease Cas4 (RecB family)
VDGTLVGLSANGRIDALIPQVPILVVMKTGTWRRGQERSLAGYALAYESRYEALWT